jgi:hypothetical protein
MAEVTACPGDGWSWAPQKASGSGVVLPCRPSWQARGMHEYLTHRPWTVSSSAAGSVTSEFSSRRGSFRLAACSSLSNFRKAVPARVLSIRE